MDGTVGEWAYEVKVSNYGPWFWAGRSFEFTGPEATGEEDEGYGSYPSCSGKYGCGKEVHC